MDELKPLPCPFCGSADLDVHERDNNPAHETWVTCLSCGASSETKNSEAAAIAAWNARAPAVPEGFALIPVELNHALEDVFWEAWEDEKESLIATEGSYSLAQLFKAAWPAMLAAAKVPA